MTEYQKQVRSLKETQWGVKLLKINTLWCACGHQETHPETRSPRPAHAGMNRTARPTPAGRTGVPRPRGDEPTKDEMNTEEARCSPPTRG